MLYNTKINGMSFKFHYDTKEALVALDQEDDLENRIACWDKLIALQTVLKQEFLSQAVFEGVYFLENCKKISRIYVPLDEKVSMHNKNCWQTVMEFFYDTMSRFEAFFEEYKDVLK